MLYLFYCIDNIVVIDYLIKFYNFRVKLLYTISFRQILFISFDYYLGYPK